MENIIKENIPFPKASRKVDFLDINLVGPMWRNYKSLLRGTKGKLNKWGGRESDTLFLDRKTHKDTTYLN